VSPPPQLAWLVAAACAALLLFVLLALLARALRRRSASRRARRRGARAVRGEREAEALLGALGYAVVERQPALAWSIECDGEPHRVDLRADLLVERDGKRYVAEVKTGAAAPLLTTAATRRQLLEYSVAYQVDSVLLVDVEGQAVREVCFFRD